MRRISPELLCSIGISVLVAGLITFVFGFGTMKTRRLLDFWGVITTPQYLCFFGGILVAVGSGITSFGFLIIRSRGKSK